MEKKSVHFFMELREHIALLHSAWSKWDRIRHLVYRELGVYNDGELIRRFVDVESCQPMNVDVLISVLHKYVEPADPGTFVTTFLEQCYPCELLRYSANGLYPPLVLYWNREFDANERPAVAVVGTRKCSNQGRETARELGRTLASKGYVVATGLTECIDAEAARGALESNGIVIGVRPWLRPLELPRESALLAKRVVIVSERLEKPTGDVKRLYFFRNRIIAGMAKAVVVVEAREGGGTVHMIKLAIGRRPTFVFPFGTFSPFVRAGAVLVRDIPELLNYLSV